MRDFKDYIFIAAIVIGVILALGAAGVALYLSDSSTWEASRIGKIH